MVENNFRKKSAIKALSVSEISTKRGSKKKYKRGRGRKNDKKNSSSHGTYKNTEDTLSQIKNLLYQDDCIALQSDNNSTK